MAELFSTNPIINPYKEAIIWESIWCKLNPPTFKQYSIQQKGHFLPSQVAFGMHDDKLEEVETYFNSNVLGNFTPLVSTSGVYPEDLDKLNNRSPIIYAKGRLDLLYGKSISIVGSRKASKEGIIRTEYLAKKLVRDGYTIVSGLAKGIDTAAHIATINSGGETIAVLGTPLNEYYPKQNKELQQKIESKYLVLSQVPFYVYGYVKKHNFKLLKQFFPERNKVMAAISQATIIVEASDTSGTLIQARECLKMGKKLFLHENVVHNPKSKWAQEYSKREGVTVIKSYSEIKQALE
ncbi:MAG: DNA-processing protein DprA [Candidatus Paceibacterota bacterium]